VVNNSNDSYSAYDSNMYELSKYFLNNFHALNYFGELLIKDTMESKEILQPNVRPHIYWSEPNDDNVHMYNQSNRLGWHNNPLADSGYNNIETTSNNYDKSTRV
jgi:hypothetical protein